jgi:hypothetical protein
MAMRMQVVLVLAAVVLVAAGKPRETIKGQDKIIAEIEQLGGQVDFHDEKPGKPVIEVDLAKTKVTDTWLNAMKIMRKLFVRFAFRCPSNGSDLLP